MIIDLSSENEGSKTYKVVDVLIIGAGTSGLILANELISLGLTVVVLESGPMRYDEEFTNKMNLAEFGAKIYSGAQEGRLRGLGGTSAIWGGALIPFQKEDFPDLVDRYNKYLERVESLFKLPKGTYEGDLDGRLGSEYVSRVAKWPSFNRRNVANLLEKRIIQNNKLTIILNATATDIEVSQENVTKVKAQSENGHAAFFESKNFVIAAGAIETTRLMLLWQKKIDPLGKLTKSLGKYFSDHLSVRVADLLVLNPRKFNKIFGYQFSDNNSMKNIRFELSPKSLLRKRLPPHFFHVSFIEEKKGSFYAVREILRDMQSKKFPSFYLLFNLVKDIPWLFNALWWRYIHKRLLYPKDAKIQLHLVIEQKVNLENAISLSRTRSDIFNLPIPRIDWAPSNLDSQAISDSFAAFRNAWRLSSFSRLAKIVPRNSSDIEDDLKLGSGIFHPTGTTRIGISSDFSVVDDALRVHGLKNLYLLSTSTLPRGGGANPTMTLLLQAFELANYFSESRVTQNDLI